jgi:GT2 family glycosyltransferase
MSASTDPSSVLATVVIPTHRRPQLLRRCLQPLLAQTLAPNCYEILVVDDGRQGATRQLIRSLSVMAPGIKLRYLQPPPGRRGPAAARNAGWRAARGEIVAFTDDDTLPASDWLVEGMAAMADGRWAATGQVKVPIASIPTDYERNVKHLETAEFVTANCFVRRTALVAIGGFDERFTRAWREDSDLHFNLLERFGPIARAPGAVVVHPARQAPWGISLREQRNMFFEALLFKKHPRLYRQRIRATPPLHYYATVLALALGTAMLLSGAPGAGLPALTVWAGLTAAFCARRLAGTRRSLRHVSEMAFTSIAIPIAAVYWRLAGALHFRARFL